MKKSLVLILSLIFYFSCDLQSDNEPRDIYGVWDPNPAQENVTYYDVFFWQGNDTLGWSLSGMVARDSVLHVDADSLVSGVYVFVNDYVRFGVVAVNDVGESTMGLSDFYGYFNLFGPSTPQNLRVIR